jgi:hypothetical protein
MFVLEAIGHRSQAVGYMLQVKGHRAYWSLAAGHSHIDLG